MRTRTGTSTLSLVLAVGFLVAIPVGPAAAAPITVTYTTHGTDTFVVPAGVTSIDVVVTGAQGEQT